MSGIQFFSHYHFLLSITLFTPLILPAIYMILFRWLEICIQEEWLCELLNKKC